jgi:histidinol-phosphatase (PHP family)
VKSIAKKAKAVPVKVVAKAAKKAVKPVKGGKPGAKAVPVKPVKGKVPVKVVKAKVVAKAAPVKKAGAAKKVAPVKKAAVAKKAVAAKKVVPAKKAAPVKKVVKPVAKKVAVKVPTKVVKKTPVAVVKKSVPAKGGRAVQVVEPVTKKAAEKVASAVVAEEKKKAVVSPAPVKAVAAKAPKVSAPVVEVIEEEVPVVIEEVVTMAHQSLPPMPAGAAANGAIYYDSHMHTPLCKHAWGEPEEYAAQGVKAGLKGIIFTCHCPMPDGFWPTVRMADSEFDAYLEMVDRAAKAFKGKLDVRLGLESEYFPGMEGWIEKLHKRADFDYILGGLHWQARDYLAKFETGTIEAFRKSYFNHLAASAETGLYDCLAHPDLVKNYHPDSWCLAIVKGSIATSLDRIAATGVAMELNTSGLNKSYSEMNPGMEMLRMMADRGIPVVIGSDAHRANRVGEHFMTALSHLQEAGYEKVSYFLKRQRIDLKISEVQASIKKAADSQVV